MEHGTVRLHRRDFPPLGSRTGVKISKFRTGGRYVALLRLKASVLGSEGQSAERLGNPFTTTDLPPSLAFQNVSPACGVLVKLSNDNRAGSPLAGVGVKCD